MLVKLEFANFVLANLKLLELYTVEIDLFFLQINFISV
jgi:hypothetical protein